MVQPPLMLLTQSDRHLLPQPSYVQKPGPVPSGPGASDLVPGGSGSVAMPLAMIGCGPIHFSGWTAAAALEALPSGA